MGLNQSKDKLNDNSNLDSKSNLEYVVNDLIADFIVSQNFEDMEKLSDSSYCDKLVLITSDLLDKKLDLEEVTYLSDKINKTTKEKVFVLNSKNLEDMDEDDKLKKKYLCNGLAKFYVQIATIYAAIAKTINPKLAYNDENGNEIKISLKNKDKIPNSTLTYVKGVSLCSSRVSSLLNGQSFTDFLKDAELGTANLNPNICTFNCTTCPITKSLDNEPGIPELENLYFDEFNYKTGKFDSMSENMKVMYRFDLINFYKVFTGNENLPESVEKFSDIKLKDYYNSSNCQDGDYSQQINQNETIKPYFLSYIENLKSMLKKIKSFHNQLLRILEEMFIISDNKITLNSELNETKLSELNINVIKIINNLYLYCELRYLKGIELYMDLINSLKLQKTSSILGLTNNDQDQDQDEDEQDQDQDQDQDQEQDHEQDQDEQDQDEQDQDEQDQDQDQDEQDQDQEQEQDKTSSETSEEDDNKDYDERKQEKIEKLKEKIEKLTDEINLIKKDYLSESKTSLP